MKATNEQQIFRRTIGRLRATGSRLSSYHILFSPVAVLLAI